MSTYNEAKEAIAEESEPALTEFLAVVDIAGREICDGISANGFWEDSDRTIDLLQKIDIPEEEREALLKHYMITLKLSKIALMHSELSETVEAIRKDAMDDKITTMKGEVVELADTMYRILDYVGKFSLPFGEGFTRKHKYNKTRPYKHGKEA